MHHVIPWLQRKVCSAQAVVALLLPTHFLYAFLYYTDVGAVTFILASYLVGAPCLPTSLPTSRRFDSHCAAEGKSPESIRNAAANICGYAERSLCYLNAGIDYHSTWVQAPC